MEFIFEDNLLQPCIKFANEIKKILDNLLKRNRFIKLALVSTEEGMPIAYSTKDESFLEDTLISFAPASAVMIATSKKTAERYKFGELIELNLQASKGKVIIIPIDASNILTVFYATNAPESLIRRDVNYVKNKVKEIIEKM